MNPIRNPFAPGAGTPPPELAGRGALIESVHIALERARIGRPAKSAMLVGLRGVGKTVLLDRMRDDAEATGIHTVRLEAPEGRSLPALLAPQLRQALLRLSQLDAAKAFAIRGLRALAGFARRLKVTYNDIEVGIDYEPEPGLADNGDLEHDLQALLEQAGLAAKAAGTALALFIDELQYVPEAQLAALITAMHRTEQRRLPVVLVGAGLPQLRGLMGNSKSYAERLFDFPFIGALAPEDAAQAIEKPLLDEGVAITPEALAEILRVTQGYAYFLQAWGSHTWLAADASPIDIDAVRKASVTAIAGLDEGFFRVRFDRCTPKEKKYLRAMAELGEGPHRSGDIADCLNEKVSSLAPTRSALIGKGMVWSPNHGDTAFTVPMFDAFMKRIIPGDWR
ncbi:MAG: ATP-binding protein [Hydrogenophaga sp.]|uniref:ATP-binding protein n=1 Tax=Hydrogenophaga sp. TaxID=1904254 RepID=UPI002726DC0E|nr:ATP-binding protein [Hydrogenophaga sp.]MDO9482047.1 ATP-binding protein [Hydrogenophaga sp.]MDO9572230.1 ATP-binding protein [Hydrogenophaga sp.]MDP3342947.1 ATP-binding protein [Hydrogenophaga sp.]MDP3375558.1 ATP-binding protein [Hydrogenophaga sp.]MDP3807227.1 ATP-binding protein [Hydrogenophaga sp.]